MYRRIRFLILHFFILSNIVIGQELQYTQKDIDDVIFSRVNEEKIAQFKNMLESDSLLNGWVKYYTMLGYFHLKKGQNDSVIHYVNKAINTYNTREFGIIASEEVLSKTYYMKGLREYFEGKKLTSLKSLYKAFSIAEKYPKDGFLSWKFFIIERISLINRDLGDYELALKYKREMLKLNHLMERNYEGGNTYGELGVIYFYLNQLDSARYYFDKSLRHYDDTTKFIGTNYRKEDVLSNKVSAYNNIGDILVKQKEIDSAIVFYRKGEKIFNENDLRDKPMHSKTGFFTWANSIYGDYLTGKVTKAKSNLKPLLDSIRVMENYDQIEFDLKIKIFDLSYEIFKKSGDNQFAFQVLNEKADYIDKYYKNSYLEQQALIDKEFNLEGKQNTIKSLTAASENQKKILRQRNIINWVLGLLVLGIILISLLIYRQRKIQNLYKIVNLEQRLLRSQLNPHFIFNSISSTSSLAEQKSDKLIPYLHKFSNLLRTILKNSRHEFVELSEEIHALESYLDLQSDFQQKFDYKIIMDHEIDTEHIQIPPMFIQPVIENSIIHGLQGNQNDKIEIHVSLDKSKRLINFIIEDNGIGYLSSMKPTKKSNYDSISGKILQERLKIYSKSFKVKAKIETYQVSEEGGTKVSISLPYLKMSNVLER